MKKISKILRQALRKSAKNLTEDRRLLTEQTSYGPGVEEWGCGGDYLTMCGNWNGTTNVGGVLYDGHPGCIPNSATPYFCGSMTSGNCGPYVGVKIDHIMPSGNTSVNDLGLNSMPTIYTNSSGHGGIPGCIRPYAFNTTFCPIATAMSLTQSPDVCHIDNVLLYPSGINMTPSSLPITANQLFVPSNIHPNPSSNPWLTQLFSVVGANNNWGVNPLCVDAYGTSACENYQDIYNNVQTGDFGPNALCPQWTATNSPCDDVSCAGSNITPCQYAINEVTQDETYNCYEGLCEDPGDGSGFYLSLSACLAWKGCDKWECKKILEPDSLEEQPTTNGPPALYPTINSCTQCNTSQYDPISQTWDPECKHESQFECTEECNPEDKKIKCSCCDKFGQPISMVQEVLPSVGCASLNNPSNGISNCQTHPFSGGSPIRCERSPLKEVDCSTCKDGYPVSNMFPGTSCPQGWMLTSLGDPCGISPSDPCIDWVDPGFQNGTCCDFCNNIGWPSMAPTNINCGGTGTGGSPTGTNNWFCGCCDDKSHVLNIEPTKYDFSKDIDKNPYNTYGGVDLDKALSTLQEGVQLKGKLLNKLRMIKLAGIKKK